VPSCRARLFVPRRQFQDADRVDSLSLQATAKQSRPWTGKVLDCFGCFSCSHDDIGARDAMRLNFSISSLSSENKWQVTGQCPVNRPMSPRAAKKALCE
jgi:hypothetical protein